MPSSSASPTSSVRTWPRPGPGQAEQGQVAAALRDGERERRADHEDGDEEGQAQRHAEQRDRGGVAVADLPRLDAGQARRHIGGGRRHQGQQRRLHQRHAQQDGDDRADEDRPAVPEGAPRHQQHGYSSQRASRSATCRMVGRSSGVDHPPVAEEDHPVGARRGGRVVGDHDDRLPAGFDHRAQHPQHDPGRPVSRAPVGSSANSTAGRVTIARAIATRCCWPPDSSAGPVPGPVGQADGGEHVADLAALGPAARRAAAASRRSAPRTARRSG